MAGTFKFELVTPERMLIPKRDEDEGKKEPTPVDATEVILPGADGQMTVMAGHAPVLTTLRPGILDIKLTSGRRRVFVRGGFAEIEPDRLTILAQQLVDLDGDKTADALKAELEAQEAMLAAAKDDDARAFARDAVDQLKALGA
jgi:F-type H+-transporting ATPase subunit epsilon